MLDLGNRQTKRAAAVLSLGRRARALVQTPYGLRERCWCRASWGAA